MGGDQDTLQESEVIEDRETSVGSDGTEGAEVVPDTEADFSPKVLFTPTATTCKVYLVRPHRLTNVME